MCAPRGQQITSARRRLPCHCCLHFGHAAGGGIAEGNRGPKGGIYVIARPWISRVGLARPLCSRQDRAPGRHAEDRKSTRLNSSHANISYAVFCLKKKKKTESTPPHP